MSNRQEYIEAISYLVPGEHPIGESEQIKAVQKAMNKHSRHRPRIVVEDVDGDGGFDYAVSGLTYWEGDFSVVRTVEYPVDDTDEDADILESEDWQIYETPDGKYLRFLNDTPAATEDMRVTYTARHTCTDDACTVADADEEAVQALAASFFCSMLAAAYAQDGDATIQADVVDHGSKADKYRQMAGDYLKEYHDHMNIRDGKPRPASANQDQDVNYPFGYDRLTHPRRER
uniref:Uncharacterized protein n=1 Tax=viral metagenome TaxID=1070528 RepID=A0A6M3K5W8_9ZZZZ